MMKISYLSNSKVAQGWGVFSTSGQCIEMRGRFSGS